MSRPFILEITESEAELKKRRQQAREAVHKEKAPDAVVAQKWASEPATRNRATTLGRDTSTVTRWLQKYRRGTEEPVAN